MKKTLIFCVSFICVICLLITVAVANRGSIESVFQLVQERGKIKDNTGAIVATVGNEKIYESAVEKWALGYEQRQQKMYAIVESTEDEAQRTFLTEQFAQTTEEQREEIIDRLIRQKSYISIAKIMIFL